jgi:hypothetical protein
MKRCPQCEFIYPDSDKVCDFDRTTLVEATESEIAQITNTPERPKLSDLAATHSQNFESRKKGMALPIAAASGLILGIAIISGYFTLQHLANSQAVAQIEPLAVELVTVERPTPTPAASIVESPSPDPASPVPQQSDPHTSQVKTAHSRASVGPISTAGNNSKSQVIVLTTGNKVEADQVWRTKDGVWYRKDGIVTLLKKNRVKAIIGR